MKIKPIIFSGPMVLAILSGAKTQTRRAVKGEIGELNGVPTLNGQPLVDCPAVLAQCPYGKPGEQLWVRENFSGPHCMEAGEGCAAVPPGKWAHESRIWYWANGEPSYGDWTRPHQSIHMPRWASRITLEIVSMRIERLQDISKADALAEGAKFHDGRGIGHSGWRHDDKDGYVYDNARSAYARLWQKINGPGSWNANPWVWVIEFKRVGQTINNEDKNGKS